MLRLLAIALVLASGQAASQKAETLTGHLMPFKCQNDEKVSHTRDCALRPECRITGYGVALKDGTFQQFDDEGNKKAVQLLEEATKTSDLVIEVEGEKAGPLFHVRTLKLR